jgi:hypothetical protein
MDITAYRWCRGVQRVQKNVKPLPSITEGYIEMTYLIEGTFQSLRR